MPDFPARRYKRPMAIVWSDDLAREIGDILSSFRAESRSHLEGLGTPGAFSQALAFETRLRAAAIANIRAALERHEESPIDCEIHAAVDQLQQVALRRGEPQLELGGMGRGESGQ
jgi:hypothetical protein